MEQDTGVDMHFAVGKIVVATSVCTGGSNSPPDCCIPMGSTPFPLLKQKNTTRLGGVFCLEQDTGVEPA